MALRIETIPEIQEMISDEFEDYLQGSHNYRHTPKNKMPDGDKPAVGGEPTEKVLPGSWDDFMAGAT